MRRFFGLPLLVLFSLCLLASLSPSTAQPQSAFPTNFPTDYSASVSLNFGTLNYSSSFDEYVSYTGYLSHPTGFQLVQSRGRYVDRNSWLYLDGAAGDVFLLASNNGDPTNVTACSVLSENVAPQWFESLATGPTMAVFSSVLPRLQSVNWSVSTQWLTERNINATLWSLQTPLTVTYNATASTGTVNYSATTATDTSDVAYDTADATPQGLPYFYPFDELIDFNYRMAASASLLYQTNITSLQAYLAPDPVTFPDNSSYLIPLRLTLTGTRVPWSPATGPIGAVVGFSSTYDWAAVQPVQLRYYNPNALLDPHGANCSQLNATWQPPAVLTPSVIAPPPSSTTHPNATSFPPSFQATMEALTVLPPPRQQRLQRALRPLSVPRVHLHRRRPLALG